MTMKAFIAIAFAAIIGFGAGFWNMVLEKASPETSGLSMDKELKLFSPSLLPNPPGTNFDAAWELKDVQGAGGDQKLRLFCDAVVDANNYLFFEVDGKDATACCVESGVLRKLGSAKMPEQLGGKLPQTIRLRRRTPELELICDGELVL
ncbi:MAG: hypothetical protein JXR97_17075, partial [Planctomycetes bacterium]|nr:hypothetical protein [Planctomycetota bacterium]